MNEMSKLTPPEKDSREEMDSAIEALMASMTLEEKIGQMSQFAAGGGVLTDTLREAIKAGHAGSVINEPDPKVIAEMQRVACEESRLGIPLLVARDVIHGFETIAPIPLGQAASWNPSLVRENARMAAQEASSVGINWTFAPMMDIARDARWGRIAESFGEDPFLTSVFSVAMIEGFQGESLADPASIAACAKHFVGYGASEGGRDYSATNIATNELRNVHLPPFQAAVDAGVASVMSSFSDLDGLPATANDDLLRGVLREEWDFDGLTISDWDSVRELIVHGIAEDERDAAALAVRAGVDMEMVGGSYQRALPELLANGEVSIDMLDQMVANVLRLKMRLGLFDAPYAQPDKSPSMASQAALDAARALATESVVLLKNQGETLPLRAEALTNLAVIGPLADAPQEQLGTWVFDGNPAHSVTPLTALREALAGKVQIHHAKGLYSTIDKDTSGIANAVAAAAASDVVILFIGEDAILSGEAHCRADIGLPGAQKDLVAAIRATGVPVVGVILAGRPLTLEDVMPDLDAILYAWHPGSMTGPALCDLLLGIAAPSGRLPVTFPKMVGQIPIYYNHKATGRPPAPDKVMHIDDVEVGAPQTSLGMTAFHLDAGYLPAFPFGFGLTYTKFSYTNLDLDRTTLRRGEAIEISVNVTNTGNVTAMETAQLYIRDPAASLTRPVKELKAFSKIKLAPGETRSVSFALDEKDLAFFGRNGLFTAEPGRFQLWVGPDSSTGLEAEFWLEG